MSMKPETVLNIANILARLAERSYTAPDGTALTDYMEEAMSALMPVLEAEASTTVNVFVNGVSVDPPYRSPEVTIESAVDPLTLKRMEA